HEVPGLKEKEPAKRTYGWDMTTPYAGPRGDMFAKGVSYGHSGFTGTSIWLDPPSATAVILLSNAVHPEGKGDVRALRRQVATLAAKAVLADASKSAR